MSGLTGREDISISKRDVAESKKFASTSKKLVFAHKCTGGETGINLLSLTMPTELSANGFANPSSAELAAAKMVFNKKSVRVRSSIAGELMQFSDFVISSSLSIQFIGILGTLGAQSGEIFMCEIQDIPVKELVVADTRPVTRTYELAVGQTVLNLGEIYKVGANLDIGSQVGDIKVWRNGPIQLRNVDNATASPSADGNFQEVDAGNGYSQVIEFNDAPVGQSDSVVVEFGRQIVSGDVNYIGAVESLYSGLLAMAPDLAAAAHGDSDITRYLGYNSSQLERRQFGDLVFALKTISDLYVGENLSTLRQYNLTVTSANWTTERAVGVPYRTLDGAWRMKFNITGTKSVGSTNYTLAVAGVIFKTLPGPVSRQAVSGNDNQLGSTATNNFAVGASGNLSLNFSSATTQITCFGDVELDGQPSFVP